MERMKEKIEKLRKEGWQIQWEHNRDYREDRYEGMAKAPTGGWTRCTLCKGGKSLLLDKHFPDSEIIFHGIARCSKKDHYCKKVGMALALDRAIARLEEIRNAK